MTKNPVTLMAIAKGKESTEGASVKRYLGIGVFTVLAVNPTKAELEKIYDTTLDKEPEYITKEEGVDKLRIDFILKSVADKCNGHEFITKASYFLENKQRVSTKGTIQVINPYGDFTWLTEDEIAAGTTPENKAWFVGKFRKAYTGEEDLTKFIRAIINIPARAYKNQKTGEIVELPNPEEAECRLESIAKYFKGDYSEIKAALKSLPDNKVKFVCGVKTTDDNKQYQDLYTNYPMKNVVTDYSKVDAEIAERKANGAKANVEYSIEPLKEYGITATEFSAEPKGNTDTFF